MYNTYHLDLVCGYTATTGTNPTLKRAKETMRTLLAKYPDGYEGWAKEKGEEPVHRVYSPTSYEFLSNFGSNPGTAT